MKSLKSNFDSYYSPKFPESFSSTDFDLTFVLLDSK